MLTIEHRAIHSLWLLTIAPPASAGPDTLLKPIKNGLQRSVFVQVSRPNVRGLHDEIMAPELEAEQIVSSPVCFRIVNFPPVHSLVIQ